MKKSRKPLIAGGLAGAIGIGAAVYIASYPAREEQKDIVYLPGQEYRTEEISKPVIPELPPKPIPGERIEQRQTIYKDRLRNLLGTFLTTNPDYVGLNNFLCELSGWAVLDPESVKVDEIGERTIGKFSVQGTNLGLSLSINKNKSGDDVYNFGLDIPSSEYKSIIPDNRFSSFSHSAGFSPSEGSIEKASGYVQFHSQASHEEMLTGYRFKMEEGKTVLTPMLGRFERGESRTRGSVRNPEPDDPFWKLQELPYSDLSCYSKLFRLGEQAKK